MPENPVSPQHQPGPLPPFPGRPVAPQPREPLRYGRWVAVGVAASFILALILLAILVPRAHRARENKVKVQTQAQARAAAAAFDTSAFAVKPNEIMAAMLGRAGFSARDIGRIVPALRAAGFNFQAMRPGDSLFVLRRPGENGDSPPEREDARYSPRFRGLAR